MNGISLARAKARGVEVVTGRRGASVLIELPVSRYYRDYKVGRVRSQR